MRKARVLIVILVLLGLGAALAPGETAHAVSTPLQTSPMVGRAWKTGASIWAGTNATFGDDTGETLTVRVRLASACDTCWLASVEMTKSGTGGGYRSWKASVEGLAPATLYDYRIFASGLIGERGGSAFMTEPDAPARFKVGVSSCMNGEKQPSQPSFSIMREQMDNGQPNLHVLLGDTMYTTQNPPTKEHYWFKYMQQRQVPEFASVYRRFPTYAIWDDHDYGPNDEDTTFAQKDVARAAFDDLWAHPAFAGDGIYHTFNWGAADGAGGVDFFMMDDRWGRDCPLNMPPGYTPHMYGNPQFEWLKSQLLASRATFKVIANGSTLNSECWGAQRQQLFNFIVNNNIKGVLFITGDIHRSQLTQRTLSSGYPLWEVTSSGIGVAGEQEEYGFAILNFDLTQADPSVTFQIIKNPQKSSSIDGPGVTVTSRTVRRSQLQN